MCLAVPGQIVETAEEGLARTARVSFGGLVKQISLAVLPEARVGDYVMVHAGFAISVVDEAEAAEVWGVLEQMAALAEEETP
ncbi:HypC/HybG/HupF family hydrogenase formation chaperone [bacterium]|nr:HypC/HybG/HupF family hydrogenase formation chaperone [bacterium]